MAEIIRFPRLSQGSVVSLKINEEKVKCRILRHEGNNVYKIKALNGKYKGYVGYFKVTELDNKKL